MPTTSGGKAILAVKLPVYITYNGGTVRYTRDMVLTELSTFCKDEAFRSVYFGRLINTPNLDALTWDVADDSFYEFIDNTAGLLDIAFQLDKSNMRNIYTTRNEKDFGSSHGNPDPDHQRQSRPYTNPQIMGIANIYHHHDANVSGGLLHGRAGIMGY